MSVFQRLNGHTVAEILLARTCAQDCLHALDILEMVGVTLVHKSPAVTPFLAKVIMAAKDAEPGSAALRFLAHRAKWDPTKEEYWTSTDDAPAQRHQWI